MMGLGLRYAMESQALVELEGPMIPQPNRKHDALVAEVRVSDDVLEHPSANSQALSGALDFDLSDFHGVVAIEELNHADSFTADRDDRDAGEPEAFSEMPPVPSFVPPSPRRLEQLSIYIAAKLLQPLLIGCGCWSELVVHSSAHTCPPSTTTVEPVIHAEASEASRSSGPSRSSKRP